MKEKEIILSDESLRAVHEMVRGQLITTISEGVALVKEHSSSKISITTNSGLIGVGRSEFCYSDGSIVRVTWKFSTSIDSVEIDWVNIFSPDDTIPAIKRKKQKK